MKLRPTTRIWTAIMLMGMSIGFTYAQHLGSARGTALGAFTAVAGDPVAFDWNPAGLVRVSDWEFSLTGFRLTGSSQRASSFHSGTLAKRLGSDHAVALRISPGTSLEFLVPSTIVIGDTSASLVTTFDKQINYYERYSIGYAFRPADALAFGVGARFLEEQITDTRYSVDSDYVIRSAVIDYSGRSWALDIGLLWHINADLTAGIIVENLFHIVEQQLPEAAAALNMRTPKIIRGGIAYAGMDNSTIAIEGDTGGKIRTGLEWNPVPSLSLRGSMYIDASDGFNAEAVSAGAGSAFGLFRLDLGYLKFLGGSNRSGKGSYEDFINSGIDNLEFNEFTGDRITLTASVRLGRTREPLARIEYVEMLSDIFSASQTVYAYRPIAKARVRNISSGTVDAKVSFYVDGVMDVPTESKPYAIAPGDVIEIPLYAIFNNVVRTISSLVLREGNVYVTASPLEEYDDRYQTHVVFRGRNDWNGDVTMLRYFVTTDDPDILQFSRSALNKASSRLDSIQEPLQTLSRARVVFDEFAGQTRYVNDPKKSQDHVQYPTETLSLRGGDCDDMAVCYAALIASMGTSVAFVDIIPPDRPEDSHIYLMFDSGVRADQASLIADNPKRYVIRKNPRGVETVWIPIETTDVRSGFDQAWSSGAEQYFRNAEVELGLLRGWMRIVDLETTY